jgi:hypothetical protein
MDIRGLSPGKKDLVRDDLVACYTVNGPGQQRLIRRAHRTRSDDVNGTATVVNTRMNHLRTCLRGEGNAAGYKQSNDGYQRVRGKEPVSSFHNAPPELLSVSPTDMS